VSVASTPSTRASKLPVTQLVLVARGVFPWSTPCVCALRGFLPEGVFPDRNSRRHGLARLPPDWVGLDGRVVTVFKDILDVNRAIGAARAACGLPLLYKRFGAPNRIVLFTEGFSITLQSATAQTGIPLYLASDDKQGALQPHTALTLLAWGSHRQRRVTHSSFSAETYVLLVGMRAAVETACVLAHLTEGTDASLMPIDAFTDCHGLFNTMSGTGASRPKEINAAIVALRDMYSSAAMSSLTWLPAAGQLADCYTKPSSSSSLRAVLRSCRYGLSPVGSLSKTHATDPADMDAALLASVS